MSSVIKETVVSFFNLLEEKGIQYAALRKAELVPDNIGNDIDILIRKEDETNVRKIVSGCAEKL